jgi:DNA-binding HxlR family transcriptional regulator
LKTIVALSYFHRKIGPIVFYAFPKQELDDQLSARIANIMDQTVSEGFFTLSFEDKLSMNFYFEIHSDWARGNNEMVMVSLIFDHQISAEMEQNLMNLCAEFCSKLQSNEEIYTAFYISDINNMEEDDKSLIIKNNEVVKGLVKELYWATLEETREKSEEEKIATLLNKRHIFLTLRKLSKGPISLEELNDWFNEFFPNLSFKELMDNLVERQLIFINQIGFVERYILLLKEVNAERIPPDSVIEFLEEAPEEFESDIIDILLPKVQEYFSEYENKSEKELEEDSYILFQIVSDSKKYNVFSELRNGLIPKDKLPNLISKRTLKHLNESLNFLKEHNIIEEIKYNNERYVVLKTNIQITTAFPEYLRKLLPKESKPVVAKKYEPKHK